MPASVLLVLGAGSVVLVVMAAVVDRSWARHTRARLMSVSARPDVRQAEEELIAARSAFGADVIKYEASLAGARAGAAHEASPSPGSAGSSVATIDSGEVEVRRRAKNASRQRLLVAQQAWDVARPANQPSPGAVEWVGSGVVRSWGLGFVGHERAFIRFDNAHDPSFWAVLEVRRRRIGIGLGVERQILASVGTDAAPPVLLDLVDAAFDDVDVAVRPGFAPLRAIRALRAPAAVRRARRPLYLRASVEDLCAGPSNEELAIARLRLADWPGLHTGQATLRLSVTGPTIMLGCWTGGRRAETTLLATSGQAVWTS